MEVRSSQKTEIDQIPYLHRLLGAVVGAQLLVIILIRWWPVPPTTHVAFSPAIDEALIISIDETEITRHTSGAPPPPRPIVPTLSPSDEILEEVITIPEMNITDSPFEGAGELGNLPDSDDQGIVGSPKRPPSILKIVEPVVPAQVRKDGLKAMLSVRFLVNTSGEVEEAYVDRIRVLNKKTGRYEKVDRIGYGLVELAIEAALQWKFRPATHEGKTVKAYARSEFVFGD